MKLSNYVALVLKLTSSKRRYILRLEITEKFAETSKVAPSCSCKKVSSKSSS